MNRKELYPLSNFLPAFAVLLPDTHRILSSANLVISPYVSRIVLHGSRGPAGGSRPDSDIDLSLLVDVPDGQIAHTLLHDITMTTLEHWQAAVEVDLAVIYDLTGCRLHCFEQTTWQQEFCHIGGVDCFGLYKIQKGFQGFVKNAGIQVRLMYPCLKIWQRAG